MLEHAWTRVVEKGSALEVWFPNFGWDHRSYLPLSHRWLAPLTVVLAWHSSLASCSQRRSPHSPDQRLPCDSHRCFCESCTDSHVAARLIHRFRHSPPFVPRIREPFFRFDKKEP